MRLLFSNDTLAELEERSFLRSSNKSPISFRLSFLRVSRAVRPCGLVWPHWDTGLGDVRM